MHATNHVHYLCSPSLSYISAADRYSSFSVLNARNRRVIKEILEDVPSSAGDTSALWKASALFQSCMDTEEINAQGVTPLLELINKTGKREGRGGEGRGGEGREGKGRRENKGK